MYNNINRFELLLNDVAGPSGDPDPSTGFKYYDNSDRFTVLAKSNSGGTSVIRYWFMYEIDDDAKNDLGLSDNYVLCKQPFTVNITSQTNFEAHEVSFTGAKGIGVEVVSGRVDVLVSSNHLHINNR